jgi:hypothetical protein
MVQLFSPDSVKPSSKSVDEFLWDFLPNDPIIIVFTDFGDFEGYWAN